MGGPRTEEGRSDTTRESGRQLREEGATGGLVPGEVYDKVGEEQNSESPELVVSRDETPRCRREGCSVNGYSSRVDPGHDVSDSQGTSGRGESSRPAGVDNGR